MIKSFTANPALLVLLLALVSGCDGRKANEPTEPSAQPVFVFWADRKFDPLGKREGTRAPAPKADSDYYFVQFWNESIPGADTRDRLNLLVKYDADFVTYVKQRTLLVLADERAIAELDRVAEVRWTGRLAGPRKITPATYEVLKDKKPKELAYLFVSLFPSADERAVFTRLGQLGGKLVSKNRRPEFNRFIVALPVGQLEAFAESSGIAWIDPYVEPQLLNDVSREIVGLPAGDAEPPANGLPQGDSEIIAVMDSGLDTGINDDSLHPDLAGRITEIRSYPLFEPSMNGTIVNVGADDGPADLFSGHGTHVAGTALGNGYVSGGQYAGIGSQAHLFFQATEQWVVRDINGTEVGANQLQIGDYAAKMAEAHDEDARIHSNSWGIPIFLNSAYTGLARNLDELAWNHPDLLVLFAAGNDGLDEDGDGVEDRCTLNTYGTARNIITVGATENVRPEVPDTYPAIRYGSFFGLPYPLPLEAFADDPMADDAEQVAAFGSRGPVMAFADLDANDTDWECKSDELSRIKPDIVAPGTFIASARSVVATEPGTPNGAKLLSDYGLAEPGDETDSRYMLMSGTSMATPMVAGAAARIRQYLREAHEFASPSASLVKAALINTSRALGGNGEPVSTPDSNQGWGRLNLANVPGPGETIQLSAIDEPEGLWLGKQLNYSVEVSDTTVPLVLTLVYTDYYYFPDRIYHDLNLSVVTPQGTTLYPNGRNDPDPYNNIEQIYIPAEQLAAGKYAVTINRIGDNPFVQQPYSLVARASAPLVPSRRVPLDIVLVMDTSASTFAPACEDISGCQTSSFDLVKGMARKFVEEWPALELSQDPYQAGDRLGLVTYSSEATTLSLAELELVPLVGSEQELLTMIDAIDIETPAFPGSPGATPNPGNIALGAGIYQAVTLLDDTDRQRHIVVIGRGQQSMSPTVNWLSEVGYQGTFPNGQITIINRLRISPDLSYPQSNVTMGVLLDDKLDINISTVLVHSPDQADEIFDDISEQTGGVFASVNAETEAFPAAIIDAADTDP